VAESALPAEYQSILAAVRQAVGPVATRQIGEVLGLDTGMRGKLEPLRGKLTKLADRGWLTAARRGFKATRTRKLTPAEKEANRVLAAGRAPVEHGFAHLKNWRILTKLRTDPARATHLLRALLVLTNIEATATK
jgi:hypothetical protein